MSRRYRFPAVLKDAPVGQRTPLRRNLWVPVDGFHGLIDVNHPPIIIGGRGDHTMLLCLNIWREGKEAGDYTCRQDELQAFSHMRGDAGAKTNHTSAPTCLEPDGECLPEYKDYRLDGAGEQSAQRE